MVRRSQGARRGRNLARRRDYEGGLPWVGTGREPGRGALPEAISECQKRETARLFIILGKPEAAVKVLCTTKAARDAFSGSTEACTKSN